jgi:predicted XRE-type DNA-binding protein
MSYNVFVDAGYPPDVATIKALRSDLAREIASYVRRRGFTQVNAARALGVPQPTVSKILNGRVSELSMEFLLRVLIRAGIPMVLQTGTSANHALAEISVGKDLAETESLVTQPSVNLTSLIDADSLALCVISGASTGTAEGAPNG